MTEITPVTPNSDALLPGYIWSYGCPTPGLFSPCEEFGVLQKIRGSDGEIQIKEDKNKTLGKKVPAGLYTVTITHFEKYTCTSGVIYELFTGVGALCNRTTDVQELSLTVKDNHLYIPFAKEDCNKRWAWIEDWGWVTDDDISTLSLYNVHPKTGNPYLGPAVKRHGPRHEERVHRDDYPAREATVIAGEKPPADCP